MKYLLMAVTALLLLGCSTPQQFDVQQITALYVADFVSDEPQHCRPTDVDLSNAGALQFFQQARQVDYKTLHDHYNYAPCAIEGTLKYQQQSCNWQVRAGATGHIQCAEVYRYFACDDCEALFSAEARKP